MTAPAREDLPHELPRSCKVEFDLRPVRSPISGVARYCIGLARGLAQIDGIELVGLIQGNHSELAALGTLVKTRRLAYDRLPRKTVNGALDFVSAARDVAHWRHDYDLVHETYSARLSPRKQRCVVTIHDTIPIDAPEYYSARIVRSLLRNLHDQVSEATAVICVSEYTRSRVLSLTGCDAAKLHVIGCGVDAEFISHEEEEQSKDTAPYCLILGNLESRKNIHLALESWPVVRRAFPSMRLLIVGRPNHRTTGQDIGTLPEGVKMLGFVDERRKFELLRRASLLVFPSRYEGFGIPALEAYASRCPVIMSKGSALTEIAFRPEQLFDPTDRAQLSEVWIAALKGPSWIREASTAGLDYAKQHTWDRIAQRVAGVYRTTTGIPRELSHSTLDGRAPVNGNQTRSE